jgi:hypothetical protein
MTTQALHVRRATIEDLPQLVELWKAEELPVQDLEKHFNHFQVIDDGGKLAGAVAMQIVGGDGVLHSEVFAQPEQADSLREKLWERVRMIAGNHGLFRLWTQMDAPFWKSALHAASDEWAKRAPQVFAKDDAPWLLLTLRDEAAVSVSLDKEFALFREAEREETARLFRQARVLKIAAAILGVGLFILVIVWAVLFLQAQKTIKGGALTPEMRVADAR